MAIRSERVVRFDTGDLRQSEMAIVGPAGRTPLTPTEAELLFYLLGRAGEIVSQRELLTHVWGYSGSVESRTVYATINRLRTKLERNPAEPRHLLAVRGFGYRLVLDVDADAKNDITPCSLPEEAAPLFGREATLAAIGDALAACALVTLTGPGGVGKTRLAVRAGREAVVSHPGGVWFCDLSNARTEAEAQEAVARGLGVSGDLSTHLLRLERALVVLDNVEQVVGPLRGLLERWLAGDARFLLTSREPLRHPTERVVPVPLLPLSDGTDLATNPAIALFVERSVQVRPGFKLDDHVADVVALTAALDGLPLAIELAAARSRVLSPRQILERLHQRFALLADPSRTARHATLRDTIAWSWDLLEPAEQRALGALSVFAGEIDLDAAQAVLDAPFALDVVQALVDRSLVRVVVAADLGGELRYRLLEAIRAFAAERAPEDAELRHLAWFARLGGPDAEASRRRRPIEGRRLAADRDNVSVALDRAVARGRWEDAAALAAALGEVAMVTGPADGVAERLEALAFAPDLSRMWKLVLLDRAAMLRASVGQPERIDALLAEADRLATDPAERLLACLARESLIAHHFEPAVAALREALDLARTLGDQPAEARALRALGEAHLKRLRYTDALPLFEQAIARARADGDQRQLAGALGRLAHCQERTVGADAAIPSYEEALSLLNETGARRQAGVVLGNLAGANFTLGRLEEAREMVNAAIRVHQSTGHRYSELVARANLARILFCQGRLREVDAILRTLQPRVRHLGFQTLSTDMVVMHAATAAYLGRLEEAQRWLAESLETYLAQGETARAGNARLFLALVALEQHQPARAVAHLEEMRDVGPTTYRSYHALAALAAVRTRDFDGAHAHLSASSAQKQTFDPSDQLLAAWAESEARRALGDLTAARQVVAAARAYAARVGVEDNAMTRRLRD